MTSAAVPDAVAPDVHLLSSAGIEVVFATPSEGLPEVLHWGAPLGEADRDELLLAVARAGSNSAFDAPWPLTVLPAGHDGWAGRPGLEAHRGGVALMPQWRWTTTRSTRSNLAVAARDLRAGIEVRIEYDLDAAGVLRVKTEVLNHGDDPLDITILEATMPIGDRARETLDFSGRWTRERAPQRTPLLAGSRQTQTRRGRTGHDSPMLLSAGTAGFDDRSGSVWSTHLAWSGDAIYRVDALPEASTVIGCGALLRAGEVAVAPGDRHAAPEAVFVYSDAGLDGIGNRLHRSVRARPSHPASPRPVTLNTWEAVYFDQDPATLISLAQHAARLGVERFVLDDGWFTGRRNDRTALGRWEVDSAVWPDGLAPLVETVHGLGMQFGLWFEPEMVSADSALLTSHPDWLLQPLDHHPRTWRHQYLLDLANPEVFDYLLQALSSLVGSLRIDAIKWDANRDYSDTIHNGRAGVAAQTTALYDLMDALRSQHPALEIEACASGGARIDLGVIDRTDRVWPSDTNDPIERLEIQRWTQLLLPPELIGAHVGPATAHTTRRTTDLSFRIAAAFMDAFGIEWDIRQITPDESAELHDAIIGHKRLRRLMHTGAVTHADDDGLRITAITATDRASAVVRLARVSTSQRSLPALLRVQGLHPEATYRIRPVQELRLPDTLDATLPPWMLRGGLSLTGRAIERLGFRPPQLGPGQAILFEFDRTDDR